MSEQTNSPPITLITRTRGIFPPVYPGGGPLYWRSEQSGKLGEAVMAYFAHVTGEGTATPEQLDLVGQYIEYWVHAPCWLDARDLSALRAKSVELRTVEQISDWIDEGLDIGMDPF